MQEPEIRIWATSTDLPHTNFERKRYYIALEDNGKRIDVELVIGPEKALHVEPYVPWEYNYTVHDGCDHEDGYCVLEDEESPEYEEDYLAAMHALDKSKREDSTHARTD